MPRSSLTSDVHVCVSGALVALTSVLVLALLLTSPSLSPPHVETYLPTTPATTPQPLTMHTANEFSDAVDTFITHYSHRAKDLRPSTVTQAHTKKKQANSLKVTSQHMLAKQKKDGKMSLDTMKRISSLVDHFANPTPTPAPSHPIEIYNTATTKLSDYYNSELQPDVTRRIAQYKHKLELQQKAHKTKKKHMTHMHRQLKQINGRFLTKPTPTPTA